MLIFLRQVVLYKIINTGKQFGVGTKVGRLSVFISLHLTYSPIVVDQISLYTSLRIWHSRIGHASLSHVHPLVCSGHLGFVKSEQFDWVSCQLGKSHALPFFLSNFISS